ncbi:MAG: hypothetical protein O8C66_09805 [Candidatus Methanoperedens sp.]|nr:hypothetical protein [Candidatus Methanoperedens sp.]MCZ7370790.1 hypothetical protein [Candidatus Methanoperedens sp.]
MVEEIVKKTLSETSRLSGLGIEKFLMPNESVVYMTKGSLYVGNIAGFKGYVTNNRVIFYTRKSNLIVFKSDVLNEIPIDQIKSYKMVETGTILKKMHLDLNEFKVNGNRSDILELYRAIQAVKQK